MNTETKVTTGATEITGATATTHNIELTDEVLEQIIRESRNSDGTLEFARRIARAAIEADRKRRGEPELVGWAAGTTGGGLLHASKHTEHEARDAGYSLPLYRLAPQQPLSESDIPAEPIVSDVEAIVRLLERREWADHVATTPLGQRLELAITTLVGEASKPHNEPVKCIGCEGKPAPENNPCAVCGKEAESVKPHLTIKYDDKGDCLYICCDSNEPAEAEENDQGILLWRAYSDGRLVGVTIPNFIGPYIKPVKEDAEASVLSDEDVKHVQDFINCDGMGAVIVEGPQYSAVVRALLARHK